MAVSCMRPIMMKLHRLRKITQQYSGQYVGYIHLKPITPSLAPLFGTLFGAHYSRHHFPGLSFKGEHKLNEPNLIIQSVNISASVVTVLWGAYCGTVGTVGQCSGSLGPQDSGPVGQ